MQRRGSNHRPYPAGIGGSGTLQGSGDGSRRNLAGFRGRVKFFQDSVLDTCRTLEGLSDDEFTLVELRSRSQTGAASEHGGRTDVERGHPAPSQDELEQPGESGTSPETASGHPVEQQQPPRSTSLSLDSLYIPDTYLGSYRGDVSPEQQQTSMDLPLSGAEPSPLTPSSASQGWRRDSVEDVEHEVA